MRRLTQLPSISRSMSITTGQRRRSLIGNLSRSGSKRRQSTAGATATDAMARAEQMWATAPNLQFLIRRGLTPRQAYITFHALVAQRNPWADSLPQYGVLLVAYQVFLFLLPYGHSSTGCSHKRPVRAPNWSKHFSTTIANRRVQPVSCGAGGITCDFYRSGPQSLVQFLLSRGNIATE
jgi:hypothetical protein